MYMDIIEIVIDYIYTGTERTHGEAGKTATEG